MPFDLLVCDDSSGITLIDHLEDDLSIDLWCSWARARLHVVYNAACCGVRPLAEGAGDATSLVSGAVDMLIVRLAIA